MIQKGFILTLITINVILSFGFPQIKSGGDNVGVVKDERIAPSKNGSFSYEVILSDGTQFRQSGSVEGGGSSSNSSSPPPEEDQGIVIKGEYIFVDPQGKTHRVTYVADRNGFRPEGDDIPKIRTGSESLDKKTSNSTPAETAPETAPETPERKKSESPLNTISASLFSSSSNV